MLLQYEWNVETITGGSSKGSLIEREYEGQAFCTCKNADNFIYLFYLVQLPLVIVTAYVNGLLQGCLTLVPGDWISGNNGFLGCSTHGHSLPHSAPGMQPLPSPPQHCVWVQVPRSHLPGHRLLHCSSMPWASQAAWAVLCCSTLPPGVRQTHKPEGKGVWTLLLQPVMWGVVVRWDPKGCKLNALAC